jgi:hypothetical protein
MHFSTINYLKSTRNHTAKHAQYSTGSPPSKFQLHSRKKKTDFIIFQTLKIPGLTFGARRLSFFSLKNINFYFFIFKLF